jgi:hypothetical protein
MDPGTGGIDCDHNDDNRKRAKEYTAEFVKKFAAKDPALFDRMKGYDAGANVFFPKLPQSKKCALLGVKGWDLSLSAYRTYKGLAEKYAKVKDNNPRVTWKRDEVFNQVLQLV